MSGAAVKRLGFVGAGRMGRPMMRRLVEAGYEVSALARTELAEGAQTATATRSCTLRKDIRLIADLAGAADVPTGIVLTAADDALQLMRYPR